MGNQIEWDERFHDIRPLLDTEVPATIARLIGDERFRRAAAPIVHPFPWDQFTQMMGSCQTKQDFQTRVIYPIMKPLIKRTTAALEGRGWENLSRERSHLYISNHRDIVLDAGFLNILFFERGMPTTEIAIGDNLLVYPWVEDLVRLNKSFIVKRSVSVRQMLEVSRHLSHYIHDTIVEREQSAWIAQREGRAKDSDDKTQVSLLKMLTLHDQAKPLATLKRLHITPISISYEYDPCDYLKAKEFQLKRDLPDYKKTQADDIENMITGIRGYKGKVVFRFGKCINEELDLILPETGRNEVLERAARLVDREIYRNYTFFPINYIAYDRMTGGDLFADRYSKEDIAQFDDYLQQQVDKVDIPGKDDAFLATKIVEMYGNTVKNHLLAR